MQQFEISWGTMNITRVARDYFEVLATVKKEFGEDTQFVIREVPLSLACWIERELIKSGYGSQRLTTREVVIIDTIQMYIREGYLDQLR